MASNKPYRDSKKVTPENVTCPYIKKGEEPGILYPVFTRDLYFSVFPDPVHNRLIHDDKPSDHTLLFREINQLGYGKMGKHYTVLRKITLKTACTKVIAQSNEDELVMTKIDSRRVDYVDAVRVIEPFLVDKCGNPFLCRIIIDFRDRIPYQVENFYCVSEHWPKGTSLCHLLQERGPMNEEFARFYLCELASAIEDIHKRGKIHRCLCICSLMIDPQGHLKLCPYSHCEQNLDCGKPCDPMSKSCGDQYYASPECVFGVDVKPAADWWSFGAIMYHLLVGRVPFTGCTLGELGKAITEEDPQFPPGFSPEAIDLMQKLLHKDPRRRLGWGEVHTGVCAVKTHPFFKDITWLSVSQRYLEAPFKPIENKALVEQIHNKILNKRNN